MLKLYQLSAGITRTYSGIPAKSLCRELNLGASVGFRQSEIYFGQEVIDLCVQLLGICNHSDRIEQGRLAAFTQRLGDALNVFAFGSTVTAQKSVQLH